MTDKITIELPADELAKGLKAVLPHASTEKMLPAICQVNLEACPAAAYLSATDKYTMGRYRIEAPTDGEPFPTLQVGLETADAKAVLKLAQNRAKIRTNVMPIKFEIVYGELGAADAAKVTVSDGLGNSLSFLSNAGTFPPVKGILDGAAERAQNGEPAIYHRYTGKFLSRFEAACDRHEPYIDTYAAESTKPMLVTVGENFAGVIMVVRPADDEPKLPAWVAHPYHDHPDKAVA